MLLHCCEAKILAAEKEQGVQQDDGRVRAQLLAVPKKLLLHPRMDVTCGRKRGPQQSHADCHYDSQTKRNSPLAVTEGLKSFNIKVNSAENLL